MLRSFGIRVLLTLGLLPGVADADCAPRDFLTIPLPATSGMQAIAVALELAYPGVHVDPDTNSVRFADGTILPLGALRGLPDRQRLAAPTIAEQFEQPYPLQFDPTLRRTPWHDPGRARNSAFFTTLYFATEAEVTRDLRQVSYTGPTQRARFAMTTRYCVAQQLQAALHLIADEGSEMDKYFHAVGGSFNWRRIAGTERLSTHSFGIAMDLNPGLGGYWRWSGRTEGDAGEYATEIPQELVHHMERFGFIWGGKWHHFDGMHFEYRPELILHARMRSELPN